MNRRRYGNEYPRRGGSGVRDRAVRTIKKTGRVKINIKRMAVCAAVFLFIVYFICAVIGQQVRLNRKNDEIAALNENIEAASRETERLNKELENVNDPEYLERMAREKLGMVTPNERVYIDLSGSN